MSGYFLLEKKNKVLTYAEYRRLFIYLFIFFLSDYTTDT